MEKLKSPTPEELQAFANKYNVSASGIARVVGVNPSTVCRWMKPENDPKYRHCPVAAWDLMNLRIAKKDLVETIPPGWEEEK